ncbi:MAG: NAD(P)-dependent oxidoreductase [Nitrosopumilus sp.]|nr:NAD(P)-dependent oxidoreductase [Nitrosopumilus sp.]
MVDIKKRQILVTGGSGFIGSHLLKNLIEKKI